MMNKKMEFLPLDAPTLLKLFFKYPLSHFPVIEKDDIYSFVSKANVLRLSNDSNFSNIAVEKQMKKLFEDPSMEDFFQELEKSQIEVVPSIYLSEKMIFFIKKENFNATYRVVSTLSIKDYEKLFLEIHIPLLVINISREVLFKNKAFSSNFRYLLKKGMLKKVLEKEELLKSLEEKTPQKLVLNIESLKQNFTLEALSIQGSSVFLLYP